MQDADLVPFCKENGLAMNADDLRCVVEYFYKEGRDPYRTELMILDTYWSDHCRHTTFTTVLEEITIDESFIKSELEESLAIYENMRRELGREHKDRCLMDMATIGARYLKKHGYLNDMEQSEENNACSIYVDVDIVTDEGEMTTEKWLLQFKNETHNHPTEIEPFGGAATCTQLSIKYGESRNFYNAGSSALARRIVQKTGCPIMPRDDENSRWWPVLYVGKNAKKDEEGAYVWKLRDQLAEALKRVDLTQVKLYANLAPTFWKISHGNDCINEDEAIAFDKRKVIVVHKDTAAKGKSKVSQGEDFIANMKKGDFFYLCRGNSIRLLGRIDSDEVDENPEKQNGWCERSYTVIAESRDKTAYTGDKKWWTPNDNSTCIPVPTGENSQFDDLILKPYFDITTEELLKNDTSGIRYWFLNANPKIWSMSSMPVGEVQDYTLYNDNGNKRRIFQNFLDAKAGDMVIGYESTPVKQVVALMRISAEQDGEKIYFEKMEGLSSPIDFATLKECSELEKMEYFINSQGSLFKLTKGEYEFILDMIRDENPAPSTKGKDKYDKEKFLYD